VTDRVYCHGELCATRIVDDWYVCGGCGHDLWPVDATFVVDPDGLPSVHGDQDQTQEDGREEADVVSRGAAEAGHV
jgi:hypothetical protein